MTGSERARILENAQTIVVKVCTNVLTNREGALCPERFRLLAEQLYRMRESGRQVAVVSSGAVGAGMGRLGMHQRPTDLRHLQACAAIGQSFLMRAYEEQLQQFNVPTAQILLTASDFDDRVRYLNMRNTLLSLFEWGCVPIINENDTVSIDEICFTDNDHLAALVTNLLQAPLMILLSVVDGLYAIDPHGHPEGEPLRVIPEINSDVLAMAGSTKSGLGKGGMGSKLRSARLVTQSGEAVILANGTASGILDRIVAGEEVGTLFLPHGGPLSAWKRWLGYTARPKGALMVDIGARHAVQHSGRSLLPIGIKRIL